MHQTDRRYPKLVNRKKKQYSTYVILFAKRSIIDSISSTVFHSRPQVRVSNTCLRFHDKIESNPSKLQNNKKIF